MNRLLYFFIPWWLLVFTSYANATVEPVIFHQTILYSPVNHEPHIAGLEPLVLGFEQVQEFHQPESHAQFRLLSLPAHGLNSMPPDDTYLRQFGRGLTEQQRHLLAQPVHATLIEFAYGSGQRFSGLRTANLLAYELAQQVGGLIWDVETREMYSPEAWFEARARAWEDGVPIIDNHINLLAVQSKDGIRATSLGMAKFGLPDIVVNNVPWQANGTVGDLMHLVAQGLAERRLIAGYGRFALRLTEFSATPLQQKMQRILQVEPGQAVWLEFAPTTRRAGDPENQLIELKLRFDLETELEQKGI